MNLALIVALITFCIAVFACIYYALWGNGTGMASRRAARKPHRLSRHTANPVISPDGRREWEAQGTFNPTAVEDDHGKVHLFYRAIGADGISRVSHAVSSNGRRVDELSPYAVYEPMRGLGMPDSALVPGPHSYDIEAHPSGGGWGGAEDPRTTRIGDRVYMTYTAFEGWDNMRIGLTSISVDDMEKGRWKWRLPRLISPPRSRNKNWVIFPEKVNGKYAILHGISPRIMITYLDSLDMIPPIKSAGDHGGYGYGDQSRKGHWDAVVKGAGPPPLRTSMGWLLLYHAIHDGKYKVGAMLLDINDPTHILYRAPQPILAPELSYENDGKPGVVYATGAVIKGGNLIIYYGGGDKHVCVAETPLASLLEWLVKYGKV